MHKKPTNTYTLNLIGVGCTIYIIYLKDDVLKKMEQVAALLKLPLEQAVFDSDFFLKMNDEQFKNLNSISDITIKGLLKDDKSQLEIRLNGRKKRKIQFSEFVTQELLFPMYDVTIQSNQSSINNALIIVEKETGLIANYKIIIEKLNLDKMQFKLIEINTGIETLTVLTTINYDNKTLNSLNKDSLVITTYAIKK